MVSEGFCGLTPPTVSFEIVHIPNYNHITLTATATADVLLITIIIGMAFRSVQLSCSIASHEDYFKRSCQSCTHGRKYMHLSLTLCTCFRGTCQMATERAVRGAKSKYNQAAAT